MIISPVSLFSSYFKRCLSGQTAGYLAVAIAFGVRALQIVFFYNIRVDASYQVLATDNLLHGHGITTAQVLANDLSQVVYTPLTQWPPGYSLLLAPFYAVFGHHYIAAGITLDLLAALLLLLSLRKLLWLFRTPDYLVNAFTLLHGFFIYYFYFIASSDAVALSFFIAGLSFLFVIIQTEKNQRRNVTGLTICLFVAGLIKYLFIPVVMLVPFFLVLEGRKKQRGQLIKNGLVSAAVLFLLFGALLLYVKSVSGTVAYISAPERGIYPSHLTAIYPFLTASFIKPDTAALVFGDGAFSVIYALSQWLTALFAILLSLLLFQRWHRQKAGAATLADRYFLVAWGLSAAVVAELMVLSLFVAKEEILPGWFWTYVEEPRYYGLIYLLVHVGVFVFYQYKANLPAKKWRLVFTLPLLLLLPEFFRGALFTGNRLLKIGKEEYSWQAEKRLQDYADQLIAGIRSRDRSAQVVVTGSSYYYNHRISLTSHVPILYAADALNNSETLTTVRKVVLLVVLHKNSSQHFRPFLQQYGKEAIGTFENFSFYAIPVQPN